MNEKKRTMIYGGVAVFLALLAFITGPRRVTPDAFLDEGELFFPNFTDPNAATTLEVIDYDAETGSAVPFKVTFKDGKWTIPSHYDYPADGKDRLAKTAASVIGIRKDEFRTDNVADYEALGVIDPLDETNTSLKGRGQRITIKGKNDEVLADLIISKKEIEGREHYRYVRIPDQKRVYASKMNIDISTKFSDWIESDLLKVNKSEITQVILKDYSINERTGTVNQRDVVVLDKKDDDKWVANKMKSDQEVDKTKMNDLLRALDELKIVGVRPKPAGLSESLRKLSGEVSMTQESMLSLQSKGYYFTRDGQLLSNEGEVQARTKDGVIYTLRFGEVVYGSGLAVSAGVESDDQKEDNKKGENRYLFITTSFDASQFKEPPKPRNTDFTTKPDSLWTKADKKNKELQDKHDEWQKKIENGQKRSDELNARFAKWYYVIPASSFDKLHLTRKDLVKKKKENT
ncbi:MAG: DUF4340 domain-containing protein [Calditrichaeota bacterium]|nr:MAG: DUF4340 domain-containing protein [Calditrichota bacterium]